MYWDATCSTRIKPYPHAHGTPDHLLEFTRPMVMGGERRFEIGLTSKSRNTMIFFPAQSCLSSLTTTAFASAERAC